MIYKQRAYVLINDSSRDDFKKAVGVDHHNCRLGKWYEGPAQEVFGDAPSYRQLLKPHSQVHEAAHRMLNLLDQPWETDEKIQDQIYDALQTAEAGSQEVMQVIDRVVAEKHPKMVKAN